MLNLHFLQQFADPLVILETTQGEIVIDFFLYLDAPKHVENFILLSQNGDFMMEFYFIE